MIFKPFPAIFAFAAIVLLFNSCCEDPEPEPPAPSGKLVFEFYHKMNGSDAVFDTIMYTNDAGNHFGINEIQYFITDVMLYNADGSSYLVDEWKWYQYVDTDIPTTQVWEVFDDIPVGDYDSIAFRFGFTEDRNESFMFVNPPMNNMAWPEFLGGGFHYLKLNMKWIGPGGLSVGNDFHLGIGQIYDLQGNITGFVHNDFRVSLPTSAFTMVEDQTRTVQIDMNIEEWFKNPNLYDFSVWGSDIMQNQNAMKVAAENGRTVFSIAGIN